MNTGPLVITGASGFIGANLCRHFAQSRPVVALEGPSGNGWRLEGLVGVDRVPIDLSQPKEVEDFVRSVDPEVIINCAAYGAYSHQSTLHKIYDVNFDGLRNLLESARSSNRLKAFIQVGSSSEYGRNSAGPDEATQTLPDSHYSVSKIAATSIAQYYAHRYKVPTWVFRIYSVYGPFEEVSRLIPTLLLKAQKGELPPLADPEISRDFLYIDDLTRAFEALLGRVDRLKIGDIYNIGTGRPTTLRDLVDLMGELFHVKVTPTWGSMPRRHWDREDWYANSKKAELDLAWRAQTPLSEGLLKTAEWVRGNPEWIQQAKENSVLRGDADMVPPLVSEMQG